MFQIGSFRSGGCGGTSRRAFLQASFGLPLLGNSLLKAEKQARGKARSVILLWLWGGMTVFWLGIAGYAGWLHRRQAELRRQLESHIAAAPDGGEDGD